MLFSRRDPQSIWDIIRVAMWPRRSWARSTRYIAYRVRRLRGSPRFVAYGFSCGAFVSCSPFVGFHFILAGILAWLGRGSLLASALGTFVGNPLTFPFIWFSTYTLGNKILGVDREFDADAFKSAFGTLWQATKALSLDAFGAAAGIVWPLIKPMLIGGVPIGLVVGSIAYLVVAHAMRRKQPQDPAGPAGTLRNAEPADDTATPRRDRGQGQGMQRVHA